MWKNKISFSFLLVTISYSTINSDCLGSKSFIDESQMADFVGLVKIYDEYFHGYICEVIDIVKSDSSYSQILIWGPSFNGLERDPIQCNIGDSLVVAVSKLRKDYKVGNARIEITEKAYYNSFHTNACGNNSLSYKNKIVTGQILEYVGTKIIDGKSVHYPYSEEKMSYQELKKILIDTVHTFKHKIKVK